MAALPEPFAVSNINGEIILWNTEPFDWEELCKGWRMVTISADRLNVTGVIR